MRRSSEFGLTRLAAILLVGWKKDRKEILRLYEEGSSYVLNRGSQYHSLLVLGGTMKKDLRGSSGSLDHLVGRLGASMASRSDAGPMSSFQPQGLWSEALIDATAPIFLQCLLLTNAALAVHPARLFPDVSLTSNDYDNLP